MLTFHSIWTGPAAAKGQTEMRLWDFEWLTWLAGLMQSKTAGPVVLVADKLGASLVKTMGLASFYDEIVLGLDSIPKTVDPEIFWAAGKLYAIPLLKRLKHYRPDGPVCSLDWDCIPWTPPPMRSRISCLNLENLAWPWYKDCRSKYDSFVPEGVNWNLAPANNGAIIFEEHGQMCRYARTATGFMERFSSAASTNNYFDLPRYVYGDAMTFAEQQLLSTAARHMNEDVLPMVPVRSDGFIGENAFFTHLWTTKSLYRAFPEARIHYTNQLIRHIRHNFPATIPMLKARDLHVVQHPLTRDENEKLNLEGSRHFKKYNLAIVKSIKGPARLVDRNIGGSRPLVRGSVVLPGDRVVRDSTDTKIELEFNQAPEYVF